MKLEPKSFGIGIAVTLAVIAIFLFPYRDEIKWAWKNRKTLGKVGDVVSAVKGLF